METIIDKKGPVSGDIIEYNGKKYYVKELNDYSLCCFDICALRNQCKNVGKEFKCENLTYFLTLKQVITEEKRKIKDSEKLIKKLENNL